MFEGGVAEVAQERLSAQTRMGVAGQGELGVVKNGVQRGIVEGR